MSSLHRRRKTPPPAPFYRRRWFVVTAIVIAVILLAQMCGGGNSSSSTNPTASSSPTTESAPATATPSPTTIAILMPDLTGMKADAAREALKAAGITSVATMTDAAGEESVWDASNWSIVSQEPAAGTEVQASTPITLTVNHDSKDEAEARAKESGEMNSQGLKAATASYVCGETWEKVVQKEFPNLKVKARNIVGVKVNELGSDDRFFVKTTLKVGEAEYTVECYVGGTDDDPELEPGQMY